MFIYHVLKILGIVIFVDLLFLETFTDLMASMTFMDLAHLMDCMVMDFTVLMDFIVSSA